MNAPQILLQGTRSFRGYSDFRVLASIYGVKAAGLTLLPVAWCPPFIAIPASVHGDWREDRPLDSGLAAEIEVWLNSIGARAQSGFILRSSGVHESIVHRGRHLSVRLPQNVNLKGIEENAAAIFSHAKQRGEIGDLALVLQMFLEPESDGHLSNERHVSPTRNQWKYETEKPVWGPPEGINSKFATTPNSNEPIRSPKGIPHQALRSLGRWINEKIIPRCHIEWLLRSGHLWVVQLDLEWEEADEGIDPTEDASSTLAQSPQPAAATIFASYVIGTPTPWPKLNNLNDFDFRSTGSNPRLYFATADVLLDAIHTGEQMLANEIDALTAGRAVLRTDLKEVESGAYNLPRTDTVDGCAAVSSLKAKLPELIQRFGVPSDIAVLLHAFLPARAAAWAYAEPHGQIAYVDALWGLPDGLQVLPHDSFQVDVKRHRVVSRKIRYKPRFLTEQPDGTWLYVDILKRKGRSQVLSQDDIVEIGVRTTEVASRLGQDAQIMWFCGIPERYEVGRNLPWYRAREKAQQAPRVERRYRSVPVANLEDLRKLPISDVTIRLDPEASLIRDDDFLDKIIQVALERRLPIELQGSLLGHTYYKISSAGVAVVLADPYSKYFRIRGRRVFGKWVRDKVPIDIKTGGERVFESRLAPEDALPGLFVKLLEEGQELLTAQSDDSRREEIADLLEVVKGMATQAGIEWESVVRTAELKQKQKGGFGERRILMETSLPQPDIKASLEPRQVRLHQLLRIEEVGNKASIPLASLVSKQGFATANIELDGEPFVLILRLTGSLLELMLEEKDVEVGDQPDLFLDTGPNVEE
jgi:predicted house-cleaning noncanonical NTP pyrophosphatase (MazG superfamily)